ncbi:MAG: FHA domain-containing protein, partial [Planctomycetes bacterium]|nr:FHA domain-containing protein [Planctomycetota bacterium]
DGTERRLDLQPVSVVIGRSADCEVVIADPRASRRHCRLSLTPQGALLEDLGSANGTMLGGEPITRSLLEPGAEFRIGHTRITFDPPPAGSASVAPAGAERSEDLPAATSTPAGMTPAESAASPQTAADTARRAEPSRAAAAPSALLRCAAGPRRGEVVQIDKPVFTIGRAADNDLRLRDSRISSHHARITRAGQDLVVEDLGSKNGILLDGQKVASGILVTGARLALGQFVFVASVPGTQPRARAAVAGEEPEDVHSVSVDAEEYFRADRVQQPLFAAALLVIVVLVTFFSIDIARRLLIRAEIDPRSSENLVENWSFEADPPAAEEGSAGPERIPGWVPMPGGRGRLELTAQQAQYPGLRALKVTHSGGEGMCGAVHENLISVGLAKEVSLEGYVSNEGAFFAGFLLEWLQDTGRETMIVERQFSECTQGADASLNVFERLPVPSSSNFARLSCIVYGRGGAAVFDRVSLAASPSEPAEGSARGRSRDVSVSVSADGRSLETVLLPGGDLEVRSGERRIFSSVWAGLDPGRDPDFLGPRLIPAVVESADRGAHRLQTSVPDVVEERWSSVQADLYASGAELVVEWRALQGAAPGAAPSLVAYFQTARSDLPVMIHSAEGGLLETVLGEVDEPDVEEVVLGTSQERISILFAPPADLRAEPHGILQGSALLVAAAPGPELSVRWVPGARRERQAARRMVREAVEQYQEGRVGEARATLAALEKLYPSQESEIAQAQALLTEWRQEARRLIDGFAQTSEELKRSPSPVIFETLLSRAEQLLEKYRQTAEAAELQKRLDDLKAFWESLGADRTLASSSDLLEKARTHHQAAQYGLAELYLRIILERGAEDALAEQCRRRLESIEKARETTATRIQLRR